MKTRSYFVFGLVLILLLSGCGKKQIENAVNWPIKDFTATNQQNKQIGLKDLKGKVWVSAFIFTSCADVCPPMTANMVKLQKKLKEENLKDVELVSFSVDPTVDTPEVLTNYAKQFGVEFSNWTFLTGYSQEFIEKFATESFKTIVKKPAEGNQVIHQTYLYLVDQEGNIKKTYSGYKDVPYEEIINDIKTLQ
ncbi:cytochrome c oxidase assembly protein [Bacillus sp. AFS076308]|uniref:SCO family protein n=1 Tax=unclassified Bacillus (in: firmicutes) TaxID=185979 RepID=UPI000BF8442D|nr:MULTISPECIES: SCO family protein [unclassified Bacillus (in: firmicutes)]PFO02509.1 cytochrome c oxidase assembly protein [Bacillus sp. AFS076308]PGV55584.1 cytochrome c oxidase assembly protein [Bacillus sp. AFS037270]